jgi:transcriptional regulator with XRE-family HTH domain
MLLADKIVTLRKRAGWSQEELAAQLGVSRQSVSKWEGAQSVPDMQKVVQMSRLFGVTTDYLLKEELGEPEPAQSEPDAPLRCVTMEQAADYLSLRRAAAPKLALATLLCVLSPAALLLLAALSGRPGAAISENAAAGIGLCVLLVLVAAAVAVFITCAAQVKAYAFLESELFETAYGVTGMVRERRAAFAPRHTRGKVAGTVLCILSAVPLFIAVCLDGPDLLYVGAVCLLLVLAGVGSAVLYGAVMALVRGIRK